MSQKRKDRREPKLDGAGDQSRALNPTVAALAERAGYQKLAAALIEQHDILFLIGPAGTGKSHCAVHLAMKRLGVAGVERVIVSRPAVECGEKLGFLPGEMNSKMREYMLPFQDVLRSQVGTGTAAEKVMSSFEVVPLAFCRGRTFSNCTAVLGEAQNATLTQLRAFLTRIGHMGKIIIEGDPGQSDLLGGGPHLTMLADQMEKRGLAGVVRFPASAVVRHPLIAGIEKLFGEMQGKK